MKKTALTFGLFSLVIAATSFANPAASNSSTQEGIDISFDTGGNGTRDGRHKADFAGTAIQSETSAKHLNSFNADSQSLRMNVKLD